MKVLVTGATGFIGSHLVARLSQDGIKIRCLVRPKSDTSFLKTLKGVELFKGDLLRSGSLFEAIKGVEKVFHLAAVSHTIEGVDYSFFRKYNVLPSIHLAKLAVKNKVKKFIFYSSIEAVGLKKAANVKKPVDETMPSVPETKYGHSKLEVEKSLLALYKKEGLPVVIIRPTVIFGPRDITHGPLKLFKSIQSGMFRIVGNGRNLVSWCYVENLVEATVLAANKKISDGQIYFVNDEQPYEFKKIADVAAENLGVKLSGLRIPLLWAKLASLPIEISFSFLKKEAPLSKSKLRLATQNFVYDISKAKKELGYKQLYSLEKGMEKTIAWYKKNGYL